MSMNPPQVESGLRLRLDDRGAVSGGMMLTIIGLVAVLIAASWGWYSEREQRRATEQALSQTSAQLAEAQATVGSLTTERNALASSGAQKDKALASLAGRVWSLGWLAFEFSFTDSSQPVGLESRSTKNVITRARIWSDDGTTFEVTNRDPQCSYEELPLSSRTLRCEFVPRTGTNRPIDIRSLDKLTSIGFVNSAAFRSAGVPFDVTAARLCVTVVANSTRLNLDCVDALSGSTGHYFDIKQLFGGFSTKYFDALSGLR